MLRSPLRTLFILLLLLASELPLAQAQEVRVFQQRPFLRKQRVELAPVAGLSINDPMVEHVTLGGTLNYHFTEFVAGGVSYWRTMGYETGLYDKMQHDFSLLPRVLKTESLITGQVSYAFLYGKFALFNTWVIHFDTHVQGGLGVTQTVAGDTKFAGDYGLGQRYFLLDWLSLNLELRHYIFSDDGLFHNVTLAAGLGFFAPFGFQYKHRK
ncbi:MAG: outer membrane beta-barrel domain-containing protein [Deltaproteobacteria bacterium]|nr:outer membrane beta-barrel domain-containing protein [Deltaproteobacteria bacterium]